VPQRFPKPSEISAALAALGVYAQAPSERELAEQAIAAGGESVLAAAMANALYGAAIGCGMLGFVGAMHWQAAHIAGLLRAFKDREQAPLG
jgi:hypothetical protein